MINTFIKMLRKTKIAILSIAFVISLTAATLYDDFFEISKNLEIHAVLFRELNTYYVDNLNPGELMKTGIDAMLASLDPYTNFYPESQIEDARFEHTGAYGGIGASFRNLDGEIVIAETYENEPAQKAGLIPGDAIVEINNKSMVGKNADEVLKLLKGAPKTEVNLKIRRTGESHLKSFKVVREELKVKNVPYYGMVDNDLAYIKLSGFTADAGKDVKDALVDLKTKNTVKGIILDLRGNPGGLLREAINVSNVFVEKNKLVVSTKGKVPEWNKTYKTLNTPTDTETPLTVLIDRGSASAAEIVSGTIQDLDRGVVIGNRSYGKGLVQVTRPLKFNAQFKVTISKYYIPSGRCIQEIDYARKNGQKEASGVPDSLQKEFKTSIGRKVYDGGGVMPDVEVEDRNFHIISKALIKKNLIFLFCNKFKQENPTISEPTKFTVDDKIYNDFIKFCESKDFKYESETEHKIANLKKMAEKENYNSVIDDEIAKMTSKLQAEKKNDFTNYKDEIKYLLASEIVSRYYFQKGRIEWAMEQDSDVKMAKEYLRNSTKYKEILSASFQIPRKEKFTKTEGLDKILIEIDESVE